MRETDAAFKSVRAANYAEGPPRQVPGFDGLQKMTAMLLAERVPVDGRVLVHGAGGGLELRYLAQERPRWRFCGIDPSPDMLDTARIVAGDHLDRIDLVEDYIDSAPEGPFDGATSLLTFHFIAREDRLDTLRAIRARLVPGAPLVLAHISITGDEPERSVWLDRHLAFGGVDPENARTSREMMKSRLTILSPDEDVAMLDAAGFTDVAAFYAGFAIRGWLAYG